MAQLTIKTILGKALFSCSSLVTFCRDNVNDNNRTSKKINNPDSFNKSLTILTPNICNTTLNITKEFTIKVTIGTLLLILSSSAILDTLNENDSITKIKNKQEENC